MEKFLMIYSYRQDADTLCHSRAMFHAANRRKAIIIGSNFFYADESPEKTYKLYCFDRKKKKYLDLWAATQKLDSK